MSYTVDEDGYHFIENEEGVVYHAYQDSRGIWTIGVGHTGPDVHPGLVWTQAQVDAAFKINVREREEAINEGVHVALNQDEVNALASLVFNIGVGGFLNSTLLRDLNAGDYQKAADDFMMWVIPSELVGRRQRERALFLRTQFPSFPAPVATFTTRDVQRILGLPQDGIFGPQTYASVVAFQKAAGLVPDGVVGPRTIEALKAAHTPTSTTSGVHRWWKL
jgi:lysozyme